MRDGEPEGSGKVYYENGQLRGEVNYKNGKRNGIFKEYDNSGKLISSRAYVDGKLKTATTKNQPVEDKLNVILPSEFTYESYITKARSIMDNPTKGYKIVDDGVKIKEVLSLCEKAIKLDSERFEAFFIRATLNNVILQWKLNDGIVGQVVENLGKMRAANCGDTSRNISEIFMLGSEYRKTHFWEF